MNKKLPLSSCDFHQGKSSAASAFHLSETLDWSSISAQVKNRVLVIPNPAIVRDSVVSSKLNNPSDLGDPSLENQR